MEQTHPQRSSTFLKQNKLVSERDISFIKHTFTKRQSKCRFWLTDTLLFCQKPGPCGRTGLLLSNTTAASTPKAPKVPHLIEPHTTCHGPWIQLVHTPLLTLPTLQKVNAPKQFSAICKLSEGALDPLILINKGIKHNWPKQSPGEPR